MASNCPCSVEDRSRRVLMVRRLHPAVTMQSLLQTFGAFGSITGCKVFTHKSGRSAGCASLEFASHSTACSAYQELQGAHLNGKAIHLQWFDPTLASPSCSRPMPGQLADMAGFSPGADALNHTSSCMVGRSSCSNGFATAPHQPATPHRKAPPVSPHTAASPLGLLPCSPHHSAYAGAAAAAAAQQQQSAAVAAATLLAGSGRHMPQLAQQQQQWKPPQPPYHQQRQLHRQASAPLSNAFNQPLPSPAGQHAPPSPHPSLGRAGCDALPSPGPMASSDPGSMAAAFSNLSAAIAGNVPTGGQDSSDQLVALQLAAMHFHQQQQQQQQQHNMQQQQIQQQLACLAVQQPIVGGSHHDSPLSPARSLQQQQQALALAVALHSQQQQQAQQVLQHQLSGQLPSPSLTQQQQRNVAQLHLARSVPAVLSSSVHSSCSSFGSQGQLQSSALDLMAAGLRRQHDAAHEAQRSAAAAGAAAAQISPFALNQPAAPGSEGGTGSAAAADVAEAAGAASSSNAHRDTAPATASSLKSSKGHAAKKQLFKDASGLNERSLSMLLGDAAAAAAATAAGLPSYAGQAANDPLQTSLEDDIAAADSDGAAAAYAASSAAAAPAVSGGLSLLSSNPCAHWPCQAAATDVFSADLLAALHQMSAELDARASPLQGTGHNAAAAVRQQQQLLGAVPSSQALQQQQQLLGAQVGASLASAGDAVAAANADGWSLHLASMLAGNAQTSDSRALMRSNSQPGDVTTSFPLSSPSVSAYCNDAAYSLPGPAKTAATAWQQAASHQSQRQLQQNMQQQQQQQRSSCSNIPMAATSAAPASQAFKDRHKQQLQLQLPDYDLVNAPLMSAQMTSRTQFDQRFDQPVDQLITTEVMPDTPATAALQSPLDVQAAMLAVASAGAAVSHPLYGSSSSSNFGSTNHGSNQVDWSCMAALLSPMQVPGLVTRRFTDCYVPMSTGHAGPQQEQQQLRLQHSRSAAGLSAPAYGRHSTSFLGAGRTLPGLDALSEQQATHAAAAAAVHGFSSAIEMFGLPSAPARCGGALGAFGATRHGSLCSDAHPQLLSFSLGQQQHQARAGDAGCPSNTRSTNAPVDADPASTQAGTCGSSNSSNAASYRLKRGYLSEGGAADELQGGSSFTFKPPVLQQLLQESRLGSCGSGSSSGGCSSSSDAGMITEPFQMPSFFRGGQQQQARSSSSCQGGTGSPTKAVAAAAAAAMPLPPVSENGSEQQQVGAAPGELGADAQGQGQAHQQGPFDVQQQQRHSCSMPAKKQSDAAAATAAAAAAVPEVNISPAKTQLVEQQQQQQPVGGFEDAHRSLLGGEATSSPA